MTRFLSSIFVLTLALPGCLPGGSGGGGGGGGDIDGSGLDGALPDPDDGVPRPDRGVPDPDDGVSRPDRGAPDLDDGVPRPDRGAPDFDDGVPHPEGGVPDLDDGVPHREGGMPHPEGGVGPVDRGVRHPEAGVDAFVGNCVPGDVLERVCGLNRRGAQRTRCSEAGVFGPFGPCDDPDECRDGDAREMACPGDGALREDDCIAGQWRIGPCPEPNQCPEPLAPVAPGDVIDAFVGDVLVFDGNPSRDPDGEIVRYDWRVVARPDGSISDVVERYFDPSMPGLGGPADDLSTPRAHFLLDAPGRYEFELRVTDNGGLTAPSAQCPAQSAFVVQAEGEMMPDARVTVQLVWATPDDPDELDTMGTDLDLYLVHPMAAEFRDPTWAIYYANLEADWPPENNPAGDASLDIDDTDGAGPEQSSLTPSDQPTEYAIGVHYYRGRLVQGVGPDLPSVATLRIFIGGELFLEQSHQLVTTGQFWYVGRLTVGGGARPAWQADGRVLDQIEGVAP